jgi:hypothetical protein
MAAPSSHCGDPASACHQDVHGSVEAMTSGGTGRHLPEFLMNDVSRGLRRVLAL